MHTRNPKQDGSLVFDCIPQVGPCPIGCNQCFYNRPGCYYVPIDKPHIPAPEDIGGNGIMRMNCGNDSNNQRELVIETAKQYPEHFYNTSVPKLDFPGPVVWTANPREEEPVPELMFAPLNLMFIRLRVSTTNLEHIEHAVEYYTDGEPQVPIVLTFMAYYDAEPETPAWLLPYLDGEKAYIWKVRHINSYWCPTEKFIRYVLSRFVRNRLVSMCGLPTSGWCRDCKNCETYYWQTKKRIAEQTKPCPKSENKDGVLHRCILDKKLLKCQTEDGLCHEGCTLGPVVEGT